jgi:hypothetical protein
MNPLGRAHTNMGMRKQANQQLLMSSHGYGYLDSNDETSVPELEGPLGGQVSCKKGIVTHAPKQSLAAQAAANGVCPSMSRVIWNSCPPLRFFGLILGACGAYMFCIHISCLACTFLALMWKVRNCLADSVIGVDGTKCQ